MSVLSAQSHLATVEIEVVLDDASVAQFYNAHGLSAISKCSTTEATTAIMASKYVETIRNVAPHSCVCVPHAGNGAPGAECFPRIGLKVRWLCRFQDLCAKLREEKSQAKPTLPNDLHDHYDHIRPLQLSHPICAAATHGASVKLQMSVLSARSHLATVEIKVVLCDASVAQFYNAQGLSCNFQV